MVRWIVRIVCVLVIAALAAGLAVGREGRLRVALTVREWLQGFASDDAVANAPTDAAEPTEAPRITRAADDLDALLPESPAEAGPSDQLVPRADDDPATAPRDPVADGSTPIISPLDDSAEQPTGMRSVLKPAAPQPSGPDAATSQSGNTAPASTGAADNAATSDGATADNRAAAPERSPEQDAAFEKLIAEARARQEEEDKKRRRQSVKTNQPPSLLLVVVEDLSREDLGAYGQPMIQTPVLDQIGGEGVRLARLAGSSHGHPVERASLWYGDVPSERMVSAPVIRLSRMSLPELLANAGYRTCLLGDCSWPIVGEAGKGAWGHWFGWNPSRKAEFAIYPTQVESDGRLLHVVENAADRAVRFERLLLDDVERFLESRDESRPVALTVVLRLSWWKDAKFVHAPYRENEWTEVEKIHASAVTVADRVVGELRKRLEEVGDRRRTVTLVVGLPRTRPSPELRRFRDAVAGLDDGANGRSSWPHAPLVVAWPGTLPPSQVIGGFAGLQDILPTLADLIGTAKPVTGGQGVSRWSEWRTGVAQN